MKSMSREVLNLSSLSAETTSEMSITSANDLIVKRVENMGEKVDYSTKRVEKVEEKVDRVLLMKGKSYGWREKKI
jgi:hypothetical protein